MQKSKYFSYDPFGQMRKISLSQLHVLGTRNFLDEAVKMLQEASSIPRIIHEFELLKAERVTTHNQELIAKFEEAQQKCDYVCHVYGYRHIAKTPLLRLNFKRAEYVDDILSEYELPIDRQMKELFTQLDLGQPYDIRSNFTHKPQHFKEREFILTACFALSSQKDEMIDVLKKSHGADFTKAIVHHSLKIRGAMLYSEYMGDCIFRIADDFRWFSSVRHDAFEIRDGDYDIEYNLKKANAIIDDMQKYKIYDADLLCSLSMSVPQIRDRAKEFYEVILQNHGDHYNRAGKFTSFDARILGNLADDTVNLYARPCSNKQFTLYELHNVSYKDQHAAVKRIFDVPNKKYIDRVIDELKRNPVKDTVRVFGYGEDARSLCIEYLKKLGRLCDYPMDKIEEASKYPLEKRKSHVEQIKEQSPQKGMSLR